MKPTLVTTLSLLLFAFTTYFPISFTLASEVVKDRQGNPISPNGKYYIASKNFVGFKGGKVRIGSTDNSNCPLTVLHDDFEVVGVLGLEVEFIPSKDRFEDPIHTGLPLDIKFIFKPDCTKSSKWTVLEDDRYIKPYVVIGGIEDHQDIPLRDGKFKIERYRSNYKLVFCYETTFRTICDDVGKYKTDEGGMLVLTKVTRSAFEVLFINADKDGSRVSEI